MEMEGLQLAIVHELELGYRPTYRGHEWYREQFLDLECAGHAIELAFHMMKAVQFPETRVGRHAAAGARLEQVERSYHDGGYGGYGAPQAPPSHELGQLDHDAVQLGLDAGEAPV